MYCHRDGALYATHTRFYRNSEPNYKGIQHDSMQKVFKYKDQAGATVPVERNKSTRSKGFTETDCHAVGYKDFDGQARFEVDYDGVLLPSLAPGGISRAHAAPPPA